MQLDRNEKISEVPVKNVRDLVRKIDNQSWTRIAVAETLAITPDEADELIDELIRRNLLEPDPNQIDYDHRFFRQGPAALQFAAANFLTRMSRQQGEELLAAFLDRVRQVNASPDYLVYVREVRLFGSFLDKSLSDYSDIDLAIELRHRSPPAGVLYTDLALDRANASGREMSWLEQLVYPETEVKRFLKARHARLSLHAMSSLSAIGVEGLKIFEAVAPDDEAAS